MVFLAPLNLTQGSDTSQTYIWSENGVYFDFTGWTGTWQITWPSWQTWPISMPATQQVLASGAPTLSDNGKIIIGVTLAQTETLVPCRYSRGFLLPAMTLQIDLTDDADTLRFQSAVTLWRIKNARYY